MHQAAFRAIFLFLILYVHVAAVYIILFNFLALPVAATLHRLHFLHTKQYPTIYHHSSGRLQRVIAACPTLSIESYYPKWYAFNGHLQTIISVLPSPEPYVKYSRELVRFSDGGESALDWACTAPARVDPARPTILFIPGLTSTGQDSYVRSLVRVFVNMGWQVAVIHTRGASNVALKTPQFFSLGYTCDLKHTIDFIATKYGFLTQSKRVLIVCGMSMGANLLVKYLSEEQDKSPVTAAISLGNPYELRVCCEYMHTRFFHRIVYSWSLAHNLKNMIKRCRGYDFFSSITNADISALRASRTLLDIDEAFTRHAFGFKTSNDYYSDASCAYHIPNVQIPLLCLSALDDPICVKEAIPYKACEENPNVILATLPSGGHLAYLTGHKPGETRSNKPTWTSQLVFEFAQQITELQA